MRVQLILDPRLAPEKLAEYGALAERHGIDAVWTSSLLGCRDPFAAYVPLALGSCQLRMGPIAVNPFDTHPARIAAALLTLNEFAAGRAQIVIGGGGEALGGLGIKAQRRVLAVRECVQLLRRATTGERFDFAGALYRAERLAFDWVTAKAPEIWVGANGPQMLAMALGGPLVTGVPDELLESLVDHLTLTGQPSRLAPVLQHLDAMREAGLTHVALRLYQDVAQSIELIGQRIVPYLA